MSIETTKQHRSDATTLTDRDRFALAFISHQYALRLDHLQVLLGQQKGAPLSLGATRSLVSRWRDAGWVKAQKFLSWELSWVWPTQHGLSEVGLSYDYKDWTENCTIADLQHLAAVNDIRLHTSDDWTSQRQIFQRQEIEEIERLYESLSQPDAELRFSGSKVVAVKVQMRPRPLEDLMGTLIELLKRDSVWYFGGTSAIREEVRNTCALLIGTRDLSIEEADRLRVLWYPIALTPEERQQQEAEARISEGFPVVF